MGELKAPSFTDRTPLKPEEDNFEEWTRKRMGRRSDPACVKNEPLPPKNIDIPCIELNHEFMPSNVLIWGTACKQPCKVLVDTGAAITVISEQFLLMFCAQILRSKHARRSKALKLQMGVKYLSLVQ